jgi:endogenous inhibitor of DNA gyrase (YacG/DUF329 family)
MSTPEPRKVKCPRCGAESLFSKENPHRPFCSERCRLIDLGDWASGNYAIPAENATPSEDPGADGNDSEETENEGQ